MRQLEACRGGRWLRPYLLGGFVRRTSLLLSNDLHETLHALEIISQGSPSTQDLSHAYRDHSYRKADAATKHQARGIEQIEHWGGDGPRNHHPKVAALLIACLQPILLEE